MGGVISLVIDCLCLFRLVCSGGTTLEMAGNINNTRQNENHSSRQIHTLLN